MEKQALRAELQSLRKQLAELEHPAPAEQVGGAHGAGGALCGAAAPGAQPDPEVTPPDSLWGQLPALVRTGAALPSSTSRSGYLYR